MCSIHAFFFITPWKSCGIARYCRCSKSNITRVGIVICRVANEIIVEGKQTLTRKKISFFHSLFNFHFIPVISFFLPAIFIFQFLFFYRISIIIRLSFIPCVILTITIVEAKSNTIGYRITEKWGTTGFGVQQTYQSAGLKHPPRWLPRFNRGEPLARRIWCNKRPARQRGLQDDLGGTVGSTVGGSIAEG